MITPVRSPADLIAVFEEAEPATLDLARNEVAERPIHYRLGSGEAEEVALLAGMKPMIRQTLEPDDLARSRARLESVGFAVAVHDSILIAARSAESVRDAVALERSATAARQYGALLGYPQCCCDAFAETPNPRRNPVLIANALARTEGHPHPRLNVLDLAIFHFIPWFPCSFTCTASIGFAGWIAKTLSTRYEEFVRGANQQAVTQFIEKIDRALSAHRLLVFEDVQLSMTGELRDSVIELGRVWPSARDRTARAALSGEAGEATARLLVALRACRTISVHDGTVFLDGAPRLHTADALLVPFGQAENRRGILLPT